MIILILCVALTLIAVVVSAVGPVRCLFWLSVLEVLLKYPVRRSLRRGDVVKVLCPSSQMRGQEVKVSADLGEGAYWVERVVAPRWRSGARVAADDVVLVKRSWLRRKAENELL